MNFELHILHNLLKPPIVCFLMGFVLNSLFKQKMRIEKATKIFSFAVLFFLGLKGGDHILQEKQQNMSQLLMILNILAVWGFLQPFLSYFILKKWTQIDAPTAAAISASFGSVSVITCAAALDFLKFAHISHSEWVIPILAIMEIPAIFSGLLIVKNEKSNITKTIKHVLFNKLLIAITAGFLIGMFFHYFSLRSLTQNALHAFPLMLSLFLFFMGIKLSEKKEDLKLLKPSLICFALCMPLVSGLVGILFSYLVGLDLGTATAIAVICASASYIAVPAAMRIATPQAKEAVYLSLSLGVAFPFNIILGIPLFFAIAQKILS